LGLGFGLEEHQARFVGQGARTGGVLSTDQKFASKETREQLRRWPCDSALQSIFRAPNTILHPQKHKLFGHHELGNSQSAYTYLRGCLQCMVHLQAIGVQIGLHNGDPLRSLINRKAACHSGLIWMGTKIDCALVQLVEHRGEPLIVLLNSLAQATKCELGYRGFLCLELWLRSHHTRSYPGFSCICNA
jgi:hypothetical protein